MNFPQLKTILFVIGVVPTLLTNTAQIGYLSFLQNSEHAPLLQPALSAQDSENSRQPPQNPEKLNPSQYRPLTMACLIIGSSSILLASFMAIYFRRRLSSVTKKAREIPQHAGISEVSEVDQQPSNQPVEISSTAQQTTTKHSNSPQFSVLIADDNNINRLLLSHQMEGRCQKITLAREGVEALQHLISERFDLVLLDLQMPGHSGLELIKIIRKNHCINRNTPVIAITAHAQLSQRQKIIAEGFDECLIKPILTDQLDEIIDLWRPPSNHPNPTADSGYSQQILDKTCQNHELALTIAKKLFEELPQQLAHIETALKNKHLELALQITHKLHGSVSFCGLSDLQKPASELEQSLINNDYAEAKLIFHRLRDATQAFIESKTAILTELSGVDNRNETN